MPQRTADSTSRLPSPLSRVERQVLSELTARAERPGFGEFANTPDGVHRSAPTSRQLQARAEQGAAGGSGGAPSLRSPTGQRVSGGGSRVYGRSPTNRTPSPAARKELGLGRASAVPPPPSSFGDSTTYAAPPAGPPAATTSRPPASEFHDATPQSPTEDKGGALGLRSTVHTVSANEPGHPQRHKTYLIVAHTADRKFKQSGCL